MQLRRNKRRNRRPVAEPDPSDIAAEHILFPMVNMMMIGMARCGDGANFEGRHRDDIVVFQNSDAFCRDRCDSAPQSLQVVAENAGSGRDQFGGIDEVLSAAGMDVNRGTKFGKSPGRAGVIEMNMAKEDMLNVVSRRTNLPERGDDIGKGRLRPGVEKDKTGVCFQRSRCDDARPAELISVEDVNFQRRMVISYQLSVKP
jgi:hypothetical protein